MLFIANRFALLSERLTCGNESRLAARNIIGGVNGTTGIMARVRTVVMLAWFACCEVEGWLGSKERWGVCKEVAVNGTKVIDI